MGIIILLCYWLKGAASRVPGAGGRVPGSGGEGFKERRLLRFFGMQTFLPYPDFGASAKALDDRRLGKQRSEALTILRVLSGKVKGWRHHPAVLMWKGHERALKLYLNACLKEWERRGFRNSIKKAIVKGRVRYPPWFGNPGFHACHRSNLLRKDPAFYGRYGWKEPPDMAYQWPVGKANGNDCRV